MFDPSRILYQDPDLIAVNKVAGELVVADRWGKETNILLHHLGDYLRSQGHEKDSKGRDLYPVHRLDRDTSGVVIFAKHHEAHRALSQLFEGRDVEKVYWLLTCGCPPWRRQEVDIALSRMEGKRGRGRGYVDREHGKPAQTDFRVLQCFADIGWLEARPRTGRTHQIRIHARELGFPLLGDPHYADKTWVSARFGKPALTHIPLHARELRFVHPATRVPLMITAPLDAEFDGFLRRLAQQTGQTLAAP